MLFLWYSILLFKNGTLLKLCDFGTAKKLEHTLTNAVGTIRYMAPEVIRGEFMGRLIGVLSSLGENNKLIETKYCFKIGQWKLANGSQGFIYTKGLPPPQTD